MDPSPAAPSRGVLITGASRGIGAACALAFARRGERVAVHCGSDRERAEQVRAALPGEGHLVVSGDLADPAAVQEFVVAAVAGLGRVDVLVNNAAIFDDEPDSPGHPLAEVSYERWQQAWRRTVEVNLLGTANVTWLVARQMIDTGGGGAIVHVGSRGAYRGEPTAPAYGASKAGLHAMGQSLAVALAPHGISVSTVAPGFVSTDMAATVLAGPAGDAVRAQSAFGRVARPEEVAAAVLHLASPEALWSSGAVLDVNGASHLR